MCSICDHIIREKHIINSPILDCCGCFFSLLGAQGIEVLQSYDNFTRFVSVVTILFMGLWCDNNVDPPVLVQVCVPTL